MTAAYAFRTFAGDIYSLKLNEAIVFLPSTD